ncbi:MAG TPA: DUF2125 domain-containing protein [Rhizomicrobium sp.]|nr:DUF2125 domain-containing protein [Rhizomicrobium sp.]
MNYSSRFWLYAPFCTFLTLATIAMVHWWIVAAAFEKKLARFKGHEAVPGITLDWDKVEVGGFPFRLDANFTNFRVHGAGAHGPFRWSTEKFALHTLSYGRTKAVYEGAGQQRVSWTDGGGGSHDASFLPGSLRASSILDDKGLSRADLDILDMGAQDFTIGHFQFHMRRDPDGADLDLMLKADAAGSRKEVQVYAALSRAASLAPLFKGRASWPQAVADWRAQGGTARLSQLVAPGLDPQTILSPLY